MKQSTWRYFQRENELLLEVEVDAPRGDERRLRRRRRDRQRERRHRDAVRIVRVDDVGPELLDDARQPPGRGEVHLGARRERDQLEPFRRALPQLAVRVRDERRPLADRAQAVAPSTAPGSGRRARSAPCRCGGRTWRRTRARAARASRAAVTALQLPELRELQEHVVRVHRRDDEPGRAVANAARAAGSCAGTPPAGGRSRSSSPARRPRSCICRAASVV